MHFCIESRFETLTKPLEYLMHLQALILAIKCFAMPCLPLLEFNRKPDVYLIQVHVYSVLHLEVVVDQKFGSHCDVEQLPKSGCKD